VWEALPSGRGVRGIVVARSRLVAHMGDSDELVIVVVTARAAVGRVPVMVGREIEVEVGNSGGDSEGSSGPGTVERMQEK